jgi:hypothetical protein
LTCGAGLDTLLGDQGSDSAKLDKGKDTARSIEHLL